MSNLFIVLLLFSCTSTTEDVPFIYVDNLPGFDRIENINERKQAFFNFLRPLVVQENVRIARNRQRIISYFENLEIETIFSINDSTWILEEAAYYKLKGFEISSRLDWKELIAKCDSLPSALVLAQAANESFWGTSRFAIEANNLFGEWCFTKGCGLVPKKRPEGASYEVRKFDSINSSIAAYMRNINSNIAYKKLRTIRSQMRENQMPFSSIALSTGLEKYSIRRNEYVKDIQSIIKSNHLE